MLWCFLGIFGDRNRQKPNIFLKCGCKVGAGCGSACLPFCVSSGGRWSGSLCYFADVSNIGQDTARCPAFLSALPLCACRVACKYGSISRFWGVFSGFYGVCVGLCCLRALRGLWGFCARVELGGLETFCVFAFLFILLHLCLLCFCPFACPFLSSLLLSSGCSLSLPCFSLWVVVSFSLSDYTCKKKGRAVLVRPLLSCCGLYCYFAASGITKLLRAVSILSAFPAIHATVKKLQL